MRMLMLGAGLQGSACTYDLLQNPDVERVRLADVRRPALPAFLERYARDPRLEFVELDARDEAAVRDALRGTDACLNALPFYFNEHIARAAIHAGVHYCDLGGNTEIVFRQLEMDADAREKNVSVVPDCGLAPGMVNILAEDGIRSLANIDSVRIYVGGLPQHPKPPLNYQIVYSLEGVLDYYTTPSWVLRDGEPTQLDALSEVEPVAFAEPVGTLEAFHTAGGLSTMAWTYRSKIRTMEYKTLRYPGHAEIVRAIRELGLLGQEPVEVDGEAVVPRRVFIACAEPRLKRPADRDLVALRVEVEGERAAGKGGESERGSGKSLRPSGSRSARGGGVRIVYDLIDLYDEATGVGAMERTTGFSLSITAQFQVAGRVFGAGVATPDQAIPADAYIAALAERGIEIRRREERIGVG